MAGGRRLCLLGMAARRRRSCVGAALSDLAASRGHAAGARRASGFVCAEQPPALSVAGDALSPRSGLGGRADRARRARCAARRQTVWRARVLARAGPGSRSGVPPRHGIDPAAAAPAARRLWLAGASLRPGLDHLPAHARTAAALRRGREPAVPVPELGRHRRDPAPCRAEHAASPAGRCRTSGGRVVRRQHGREAGPRGAGPGGRAAACASADPPGAVRRRRGPATARAAARRVRQRHSSAAPAGSLAERAPERRRHSSPAAACRGRSLRPTLKTGRDSRQRQTAGRPGRGRRAGCRDPSLRHRGAARRRGSHGRGDRRTGGGPGPPAAARRSGTSARRGASGSRNDPRPLRAAADLAGLGAGDPRAPAP
jgi:hypothetical protein